jgi:alginate O-acetyltransferase complex protein AlgJ
VGDSHLLVFHAGGDMHATGAGLADRLAQRLGAAVDVVGVRGSGASPSRIALLRRGDGLAGKKAVIWLMTAREFTETQGWRLVPVVK